MKPRAIWVTEKVGKSGTKEWDGFFHTWARAGGKIVAIVEDGGGNIKYVDPLEIKFKDPMTT